MLRNGFAEELKGHGGVRRTNSKYDAEDSNSKLRGRKISKSVLLLSTICLSVFFAAFHFIGPRYMTNELVAFDGTNAGSDLPKGGTITSKYLLDCRDLLNADIQAYRDNGQVIFRRTVTKPPFYISLHNQTIDHIRWSTIMGKGYYYETGMYEAIHESLDGFKDNPREAIVLDVGGNIGWFTLIATSLGHKVITFEPNNINNLRHCESLQMNGWLREDKRDDLVELYEAGVGDKHGEMLDFYDFPQRRNPGQGTFSKAQVETGHKVGSRTFSKAQVAGHKVGSIITLSLDTIAEEKGWFKSRPNIAFVKVDVEGFELNVLRGASRMVSERLINNIVFEFKQERDADIEQNINLLRSLISSGYELYKDGGSNGPHDLFDIKYETAEDLYNILSQNRHKHHSQNLWWRLI